LIMTFFLTTYYVKSKTEIEKSNNDYTLIH